MAATKTRPSPRGGGGRVREDRAKSRPRAEGAREGAEGQQGGRRGRPAREDRRAARARSRDGGADPRDRREHGPIARPRGPGTGCPPGPRTARSCASSSPRPSSRRATRRSASTTTPGSTTGSMWATSWALTKLTPADEERIAELVSALGGLSADGFDHSPHPVERSPHPSRASPTVERFRPRRSNRSAHRLTDNQRTARRRRFGSDSAAAVDRQSPAHRARR